MARDLDGDGQLDLFVATTGQKPSRLLLGDGNLGFAAAKMTALPPLFGTDQQALAVDLDGDGDLDFVTAGTAPKSDGAPGAAILLNLGLGVFSDVTEVRLAGGSFNASGVGDVDADGDQDLFFTADKEPCRLYLGDGHGAFQRAAPDAIPYDPAPGAGIPALGDLDGDGTLDVLDSCPDAPNPDQANLDSLPFRCASATSCLAETGCELRTFASSAYFVCKTAASSWAEASAACVARGGALVTVSSADENAFLLAAGVTDAWIGYTDAAVEGTFVWASGEGVFTSWGMAQPDDAGGNEDCATFLADGTWNDAPCDGKHAYVCEDLRARQPDPGDACDACPTAYEPGSVPVTLDGGVCGGTGGGGAGGGAP